MSSSRRRRFQRGAVAVETALSLIILTFVATAGINFGDAMIVRSRLTHSTSRAARICSMLGPAAMGACVEQQVRNGLDTMATRCDNLNITQEVRRLNGMNGSLDVVQVEARCLYNGGVWAGLVNRWVSDPLLLTASATMPIGGSI